MYCSKCGSLIDGGNAFCPKCGNKIGDENATQGEQTYTLWQDIKAFVKKRKTAIGIFLLIISFFMMACGIIDLIQSGGNSSSNAWRGYSEPSSPTGPLDVALIILAVFGIIMSVKLFKSNKK